MLLTTSIICDFVILLGTLFVALYLFFARHANYWKKRGVPFVKPVPFFGTMLDVFTSKKVIGLLFQDLYKEMKTPYLGIFIMDRPGLLTSDLNLVKNVLIQNFNNFVDRDFAYSKNTLGAYMMSLMRGDDWKLYRKKLSPGFSKAKANFDLLKVVNQDYVRYLEREVEKNELISVKDLGQMYGTEAITYLGLGTKADCFVNKNSIFTKMAKQMFDLDNFVRAFAMSAYLLLPSLVPIFKFNIMDPEAEAFLYGLFTGAVEHRQRTKQHKNDFVDVLLKLQKDERDMHLDMPTLGSQAIAYWIGGYETTSILISTCLYELGKHPDIQTKVREEINTALEKTDGEFTYEIITEKLKYFDAVVKETLRKYPPLPVINRVPSKDFPIPGTNIVLEKGVPIYIPSYAIHMDPKYFPDPEEFIPERFLGDNTILPYTYMPFGIGPRMCPGEKIAMVADVLALAHTVKNFEFTLRDDSQRIMEFYTKTTILSPKPDKMILRFKKIK
nr:cytochrome P450 [Agasicles hygrophila]